MGKEEENEALVRVNSVEKRCKRSSWRAPSHTVALNKETKADRLRRESNVQRASRVVSEQEEMEEAQRLYDQRILEIKGKLGVNEVKISTTKTAELLKSYSRERRRSLDGEGKGNWTPPTPSPRGKGKRQKRREPSLVEDTIEVGPSSSPKLLYSPMEESKGTAGRRVYDNPVTAPVVSLDATPISGNERSGTHDIPKPASQQTPPKGVTQEGDVIELTPIVLEEQPRNNASASRLIFSPTKEDNEAESLKNSSFSSVDSFHAEEVVVFPERDMETVGVAVEVAPSPVERSVESRASTVSQKKGAPSESPTSFSPTRSRMEPVLVPPAPKLSGTEQIPRHASPPVLSVERRRSHTPVVNSPARSPKSFIVQSAYERTPPPTPSAVVDPPASHTRPDLHIRSSDPPASAKTRPAANVSAPLYNNSNPAKPLALPSVGYTRYEGEFPNPFVAGVFAKLDPYRRRLYAVCQSVRALLGSRKGDGTAFPNVESTTAVTLPSVLQPKRTEARTESPADRVSPSVSRGATDSFSRPHSPLLLSQNGESGPASPLGGVSWSIGRTGPANNDSIPQSVEVDDFRQLFGSPSGERDGEEGDGLHYVQYVHRDW
ncbi:proteophosphoglycan ppg4 [Angomonas deanei]|nr:proteophosphoglycan ppg4 [Angomonas deanei]|eukprot:EPY16005.1 proteophosphoglycan ppg4 [Angomonas deanei]